MSCCLPRCCTPWMELLQVPAYRTGPVVRPLGEPISVVVTVGSRRGSNGRYPLLCLCTSSSSSTPSPLPPPPLILPATSAITTSTITVPVTTSGATVVSTTITTTAVPTSAGSTAPVVKKRKRYRKAYPGESKGIVEEMRFVAMRLRNDGKGGEVARGGGGENNNNEDEDLGMGKETWQPSMKGYLKHLVDSKLIFETIERTVDHSEDVAWP